MRIVRKKQAGVGLLEVLISLVVIAMGLIGLATLQTISLRQVQATRYQQQANGLLSDLVQRILSQPVAAKNGYFDVDKLDGTPLSVVNAPGSTDQSKAEYDRYQWYTHLTSALPSPRFSISSSSVSGTTGTFVTITMTWDASLKGVGAANCNGANSGYVCQNLSLWVP